MAIGDLSADQKRYAAVLSSLTSLNADVITAWIGSESGWGVEKTNHNYLNVGPGEQYTSTDQAAERAAGLINRSSNYAGIRKAISADQQISAIGSSPWGTSASLLGNVWGSLKKKASDVTPELPSVGDVAGSANSAITSAITTAGVTLLLAAIGGGLIVLGILRLTGVSKSDVVGVIGKGI